jgi:DNA repair exonuclease SbcCD ATPase subunit
LQLKAVRFQNFRTFGNELAEIRLDGSPTTLVIGTNGAGKTSSLLESVCFGLFGQPFNPKINKGQLVNSITKKGLLVELDVSSGGRDWTIRRGIKPNFLEVLEQHGPGETTVVPAPADVRDFQEWIEKNILRMNVHTFRQIVVLGKDTHVPFMRLPAANRRAVVEDILDIQVFTVMNQVLKEKTDKLKAELVNAEQNLKMAVRVLELEREKAAERQQDVDSQVELKLLHRKEHETKRERAKRVFEETNESARALAGQLTELDEVEQQIDGANRVRDQLTTKLQEANRKKRFFSDHSNCPTCSQSIGEGFRNQCIDIELDREHKISGRLSILEEKAAELQARRTELVVLSRELSAMNKRALDAANQISLSTSFIEEIDREVEALRRQKGGERTEDRVQSAEEDVRFWDGCVAGIQRQLRLSAAAAKMLKDDGIKAATIRDYIPEMNRQINHYLGELDLFVDFHLDENFNEFIRSRYRDEFSYEMFSAGEKLRIDLAILFAWRAIAKMRTGATINLLVFDEILDSSLDDQGIDDFLKVVNGLTGSQNVFIISHKREQLSDKFPHTLRFTKRNNFSKLEVLN